MRKFKKKIGRNKPCPCGSGKKYKQCCLLFKDGNNPFHDKGVVVVDYTESKPLTMNIGSPGVTIGGFVKLLGDYESVIAKPKEFVFALGVDIPAYFPLEDGTKYNIEFQGTTYVFFHKTKKRGQQFYSTIDTTNLPFFSSFQIQGDPILQDLKAIGNQQGIEGTPRSYELILHIINKINVFLGKENEINLSDNPVLSYHILFFNKNNSQLKPIAKLTYPYSGTIKIHGPDNKSEINNEDLKHFLKVSLNLAKFTEEKIIPDFKGRGFSEQVFLTAHDFFFYCCQHPGSLGVLQEEQLRDLYLIILKSIYSSSEGEVYNYDGKLDFKITNPGNKYEFITGEFKWWDGIKTFEEATHQALRKHATGQEKEIYILILNKNKNISNVLEQVQNFIQKIPEFLRQDSEFVIPKGSKQLFKRYIMSVKGHEIPTTIGIANLYYEKI